MRAALFIAAALWASCASARPVLMISIDGLRPADVIEAEQRGLRIPHLRRFVAEGAYASGVRGVLPTVTYPSHVTLVTGASPAKHGVVSNTTFDPMQINYGGWYWYATDIRVPTLWAAVTEAGKTAASLHWPVSVAASGVTWNIPQIWRSGHADDAKLVTALSTAGLVAELERATGEPYAAGIDESVESDERRGRFAAKLIALHKPDFMTAYLTSLDHEQHAHGPGSPEAHAALERIDAVIGGLVAAELAAHPDAAIAIVSDHGFEAIGRETNFFRAFMDAGLIRLDAKGAVTGWDAMPWPSGGSAAIVLARPDDKALAARVADLLAAMQADPANGIAAVADRAGIARMGGNPEASFFVNMVPDAAVAGAFGGATAPLHAVPKYMGTHGYFPEVGNLRATFMIMGQGLPKGRALGEIDMRAIAPTIAAMAGVRLTKAEVPPVAEIAATR
ncbi:alkaline phosphatase family protein [Rhizorhabdus dicambivorans]|uniref:Alkaline phosphatase family protein n=1 Tax=Rhizorhabdus dicambivorans TaxID=1850238 RepID=A0A2A4FU53_9SPHN|nr:ectonucleotide pyrophosphatase/phosphodiesterase [Rhizorhabdus dicambivorans]ATE64416.1 alkaline phosphatase family protein [Rhizorhabdus dicambivorans]PCE41234.1 alkaline phosphatase family protein [Rhizorhabdus dicambivorans]